MLETHLYRAQAGHPEGNYDPFGKVVNVFLPSDMCAPRWRWWNYLSGVIRHELTHAADPWVNSPGWMTRYGKRAPMASKEFCKYITSPHEMTSFLANVEEELKRNEVSSQVKQMVKSGHIGRHQLFSVVELSETYREIKHCLGRRDKQRFALMVARLWSEGTFGPLPT
jgi:hypothetical protein